MKPDFLTQQCVACHLKCDRCDAGHVGYTCQHLYQPVDEHETTVGKHLKEMHRRASDDLLDMFSILRKCTNKFDCLVFEMPFIKAQQRKRTI